MHVSVVFFRRSADYPSQRRQPRLCVFGPRIIPPSILPSNDHLLHFFPPALGMDADEISHPTNRVREAHPNQHTCGHGLVRQRQRLRRDGINYSPISIHHVRRRFRVTGLRSWRDNIGRELANCLDAEFVASSLVKLTERSAHRHAILLCKASSLSQAARRGRGGGGGE